VLEREALIVAVVDRNPGIESMRQAWLAASEREAQASAFADLRVMTAVAPESIYGDDRIGYMLQVEQMLPWSGKRGAMGAMEQAMADSMKGDYESARLGMALMASMLYDELWAAERMLGLNEHHIARMTEMKESAEARYVASMASLQDPIEAEVAIARMEKEQASIESMIAVLRARINALLHRPPGEPLPPMPDSLDVPLPEIRDTDALQQIALGSRPELASVEARVRAGRAEAELADRERYPDLVVSTGYNSMMMGSEHRFTVGVGFNIPNQQEKRRAQLREAEAKVEMERQRFAELEDAVRLEVETARVELEKTRRILEIYDSRLVPAGRDRFAAAEAGFSSGTNDFSTVVSATNGLRELEIERETTLAEIYTNRARLDRALGRLPFVQEVK
ncbi:MAG TPA: TolC family protein, partial [Gammaproteobacteria bacterium]|nr:TolC family protein [Gammaproteobacteria bacterium]